MTLTDDPEFGLDDRRRKWILVRVENDRCLVYRRNPHYMPRIPTDPAGAVPLRQIRGPIRDRG